MKVWIRRVLNLLLYLSFCIMIGTGLLLQYKLLPGGRGGRGLSALGMSRHDWGAIHFWISLAFILFVVAHLVMSWGWLKRVAANKRLWPVVIGLLLGLAIVAGIYYQPIENSGGGHGRNSHQSSH